MSAHTTSHVLPKSAYYRVYAALMVLLAATVGFAFIDLGPLNFLVSLAIADEVPADNGITVSGLHAEASSVQNQSTY